jgi:hypothetical protein
VKYNMGVFAFGCGLINHTHTEKSELTTNYKH